MQEYEAVKKQSEVKLAAHKCVLVYYVCRMYTDKYETRDYEERWAGEQAESDDIIS